ncbi:RNA-binding protein 7 [Anguilla anguilla]|uniref:RNA-binding protein 7 n=1 Tax=Anguilla anguilla TaxID=7936 RepID=UPI0015AE24D7|nr:RNA-binding protein 7 [Anguilla anguilla]
MGIADEADRSLFVGNLDPRVTEELLFELFLQAGPMIKVRIPKDNDGKPKHFGFVNFKHEVSVMYAMKLFNGTSLYGRPLKIQFRSGSSHSSVDGNGPGNSQNSSPMNSPALRGGRFDRPVDQMASPSYSPPQLNQKAYMSPENLQRQVLMNNMWQLQQLSHSLATGFQQGYGAGAGAGEGSPAHRGSWQQDGTPQRGHRHPYQQDGGGSHRSRDQRFSEPGADRHRRGQRGEQHYHHDDRTGGGRSRDYPDRSRDGSRDGRWRRY